jgi:hypothetical protein
MSGEGAGADGSRAAKAGASRGRDPAPEADPAAAGLFVSPVQINASELIHYIKEQAAEQAASGARDRLNFFFTAIGLVVGIVTAGAAGLLYIINLGIDERVTATVDTKIAALKGELNVAIAEDLRTKMSAVILLPLLVSEATSYSLNKDDRRRNDRDRILAVMHTLKPEVLALDGDARTIAMRRIEDILDAFYNSGDYGAALELYDIFGTELLALDGIQISMARIFSALLLYDPEFPTAHDDMLQAFVGTPSSGTGTVLRWDMTRFFVVQDLIAGSDDNTLAARLAAEEAARPGFLENLATVTSSLRREFEPGGVNESAYGIANLDRFDKAILLAMQSGIQSPPD